MALTRAAHRGAPLGPVVELDTVRREWIPTDAEGNAVATVTDDRVTGHTLGAETGAKAVQELLGEHQDSVVARGLLRELGAAAPGEGGNGFAFGGLLRDEQARAERVEADLDDAYAALRAQARTVIG